MKTPARPFNVPARALAPLLAAVCFSAALPAQTLPPINGAYDFFSDITYDGGGTDALRQQVSSATVWRIADGVTVTIQNNAANDSATNGGIFGTNVATTLRIEPIGTTGRVEFIGNTIGYDGAIVLLGSQSAALLDITNAAFIRNQGEVTNVTSGAGGGAIRTSNGGKVNLKNVLFEANRARMGGAIFAQTDISINSGTFAGNYADSLNAVSGALISGFPAGYGGALFMRNTATMRLLIARQSSFYGNWATRGGGALSAHDRYSMELWDPVGFSDNFAGYGGAIYDNIVANEAGEGIFLKYTGTAGIIDFVYSGNKAKGSALTVAEVNAARASGTAPFTPLAKGGGFYYSGTYYNANPKTRLNFEIATGVTVSIGAAGNPASWDSIATMDATAANAQFNLTGSGAGRLILHADNSYYQGAVNVGTGSLLLGNSHAALGGVITVAPGAGFGGSGTLITHRQNDSVYADRTGLTLGDGATLTVGTAAAADAEILYIAGNLTAGSGVLFSHDLFPGGSASKLFAENISIGASGTINIGLLATGTFAIMEWTGAGVTAPTLAGFALTVGGVASSPRAAASLSLSGNTLVVTNTAINNLLMKWTGAEGAEWTRRPTGAQQNWGDGGGSAESRFLNADSVVFDGVADAANPGNRVITIDDGGVTVSDMKVTGSELYKFQGLGGITADAGALGTAAFAAAGQLEKSGGGGLVFANTGANTFLGGIKIAGGMITFDRAEQIGSGTGGIVFTDSGTLRATETVSGTVFENIIVNAGKIAGLVVDDGGALAFAGTLAASGTGATLRKTGGGTVSFYSDNSASSAAVAIDEGALTLAGATAVLGGKITVAPGATLGGVGAAGAGGSVTVAGGGVLDAGLGNTASGTLTVHNLETTGGAVLRMNLFKDADTGGFQQSDRIYGTGTSAISGANIIDLASFASGTYNLGSLTALASGSTSLTLSGMTIPAGGRLSGALTSNGGVLQLVTTSDQSREIRWTGAGGTAWNLAAQNWTGGAAVNQFSYGDRVLFDGAAGARAVYIDAGEVRISDMSVSGAADYTFTGGGIHASPENTQDDGAGVYIITDASGKLTKEGGGVLSFENSGNTFSGGVEINGGAIAISKGAQLATTASTGITFTGDATLRAATDLVLDDDFVVNAAKTATIDSNGYIMTLQGSVGGAADSTLAKDGVGAVVLESDLSGFSGTLAVRAGVLRAGGDNVLTNGSQSAIVVNAGATLDLDGHDQSIVNLSGIGEIALGDARLTYTVGAGSETFAGGFSGNGSVLKDGGGKWILSGSSSNSGGFILQAGELGLASAAALGAGRLTLAGAAGALSIEAAGLIIPNNMTAGTGTLTIESSGRAAEFSGMIGGDTMVLAGSGTLALSGTNYYTNLKINTPLAIARRAESIAGTVDIADGSVLEFRGAAGGLVSASIRGDSVLFTDSALILNGQNQLKRLAVGVGSRVTLSSSNALGGPSASATVQAGGQLVAAVSGITGNNITVDGGALAFGSTHLPTSYAIGSLNLSGTLSFVNGGEVRLAGLLHTGIHTAATAAGGITGQPEYNANQDGMFMTVDVDGDSLLITAYNMALEPGKDIAVGLDALRASARAVSSHLDDSFLALLAGREPPAPQNSPWVRLVGSFAEHETDKDYLGYKTDTWAGIFGFDYISSRHSMLGGYVSSSFANIKTDNAAATDMKLATLGLYGAWRANKFYFTSNLAAGLGKADTDRLEELGNRVTGSYHIRSFGAGAELGYMMPAYTRSIVRPSIGLRYNNLCFSDYAERGAGAVILDRVRADSLQAALKVDISTPLPLPWGLPGGIDIGFGWWRELNDKPTAARATLVAHPEARLQIRGDRYDESSVNARLGLRAMLDKHTLFSLSYDFDYIPFGDHHTTTQRNTFIASIRKIW